MFEQTFKKIDDVLWKEAGCTAELDHIEQTSWLLFLKYLDDLEKVRDLTAELESQTYKYILAEVSRFAAVRTFFAVSGSRKQLILLVRVIEDRPKEAAAPTKALLVTVDLLDNA